MSQWRASTWGEEISLEYGKALRGYDAERGKYRVFGSNGPIGWTDKPLVSGPGVILGRKGAYRGIEFSHNPFFVIDTAYYVVPKSKLDMRWLYYAIKYHKLGEIDDGSPIPSTTRSAVYVRDIDVPPLAEQKVIAGLLAALDDKIELNRRMNETLERIARALFKSWFVDFDPVRARMDGRQPAGMSPEIAALFPSEFEPVNHKLLPKSWTIGPILEIADLLSGGTPKTSVKDYWDGDIPWASAKDVSQCGDAFLIETDRSITKAGLDKSATRLIEPLCTVIVARGATTGRLAMFGKAIAMNQTCYALRSRMKTPIFLYCHTRNVIDELVNSAHGSVFDTITTRTFETTPVLLPDRRIAFEFDNSMRSTFELILANLNQGSMLSALRDALLPKLLSGELRVPVAKKMLEEVL